MDWIQDSENLRDIQHQTYTNLQSYSAGIQYKRRSINAGLSYRSGGGTGPGAVVISLIFDLFINKEGGEKLRFGLSHDAPMSKMSYTNTSGTTEGSIGYETTLPNHPDPFRKFQGSRRCYDFY